MSLHSSSIQTEGTHPTPVTPVLVSIVDEGMGDQTVKAIIKLVAHQFPADYVSHENVGYAEQFDDGVSKAAAEQIERFISRVREKTHQAISGVQLELLDLQRAEGIEERRVNIVPLQEGVTASPDERCSIYVQHIDRDSSHRLILGERTSQGEKITLIPLSPNLKASTSSEPVGKTPIRIPEPWSNPVEARDGEWLNRVANVSDKGKLKGKDRYFITEHLDPDPARVGENGPNRDAVYFRIEETI